MEVLFSVVILSIAAMGVMGVLTFGVVAGDTAGNISTANQIGREMIENIRVNEAFRTTSPQYNPDFFNDAETDRVALNAAPFDAENEYTVFNNPRFSRNIQITAIPEQGLDRIQIRIFWEQNGAEKTSETIAFQRR